MRHLVFCFAFGLLACENTAARDASGPPWLACGASRSAEEATASAFTMESSPTHLDGGAGLTTVKDRLIALDLRDGRLSIKMRDSTIATFGATGGGPGEFAPYGQSHRLRRYPVHWVDARSDTIVTFDGRRLSFFSAEGVYLGARVAPSGMVSGAVTVSNVRLWRGKVLIGTYDMGAMPKSRRALSVRAISTTTDQLVADLALPALPNAAGGRPFDGLSEAKPSWDLVGDCIVATDGHSDSLFVTDLLKGKAVAVVMPLPMHFRTGEERTEARLLGTADLPLPLRPARVHTVVADPFGWIWMEPSAQPARLWPRIEVWRFHLQSQRFRVDTLSAFPLAWDSAGCGIGFGTDANDAPQLVRMCRRK